jgi:hypothetical protein
LAGGGNQGGSVSGFWSDGFLYVVNLSARDQFASHNATTTQRYNSLKTNTLRSRSIMFSHRIILAKYLYVCEANQNPCLIRVIRVPSPLTRNQIQSNKRQLLN